jgi:arylsulfatase A-like enzyme
VQKLQEQGLYDNTLVIVSAKHGQSPIDPSLRKAINGAPYAATPGFANDIEDDVALIWLQPETRADTLGPALDYLKSQSAALAITYLLTPEALAELYRDPATDSRTPDFIALPQHGVIYTKGSKLAEHGGFSRDDRNVALLVSAPDIAPRAVDAPVETTQIAPTILKALGLDPTELSAVRQERTKSLPGLFADRDWWADSE